MIAKIETITPAMAEAWLLTSPSHQRGVNARHVKVLVDAMTRGQWRLNGETIVIDAEGHVVDGQHRLIACRTSGVAIQSWVVRGVDAGVDLFATINIGKSRSLADVLKIEGASEQWSEHRMASVLRALATDGSSSSNQIGQLRDMLSARHVYQPGLDSIATAYPRGIRKSGGGNVVTGMVVAAATSAILHGADAGRCASYLDALATGVVDDPRNADSAAITVRNALLTAGSGASFATRAKSYRRVQRGLLSYLDRTPHLRAVCPDTPVWSVGIGSEWWNKRVGQ